MPSFGTDDGGWGTIASGFGDALFPDPSKRARMALMGAQYKKVLQETADKAEQMKAVREAIAAYPDTVPVFPEGPAAPERQEQLDAVRKLRLADNAAASQLASSAADYAKGVPGIRGQGAVLGGVPTSRAQQDVIETQLSGIGAGLPGYTKEAHTYQPLSPSGEPQGPAMVSRRIPTDPATLVAPGKAGPKNDFENDATMVNYLAGLQKRLAAGDHLSLDETQRAGIMLDRLHPVSVEPKDVNGRLTGVNVRKSAVEAGLGPLADRVDLYRNQYLPGGQSAAAQPGPSAQPVPFGGVGAGALAPPAPQVGGFVGAPAMPADPTATAVPVVQPTSAPAAAPASAAKAGMSFGGPQLNVGDAVAPGSPVEVRKEIQSLPSYKNYVQAVPVWNALPEHFKTNSTAADLAGIYALAKLYDPGSVVREGELKMASNTGSVGERLVGMYSALSTGSGRLTKEQRIDLLNEGAKRMASYEQSWAADRKFYADKVLPQVGVDPAIVIPELPAPVKWSPKEVAGEGRPSATRPSSSALGGPSRTAATAAPGRTIRINPQTGAIEAVP